MQANKGTYTGMGLFSSVAVIVGACIGSAIFSISGMTVHMAGAGAVLSWVAAAAIMGAYGLIVTRLAVTYPRSGGVFVFPRFVFRGRTGRFLGFFSAWGYVVSNSIAIGFSAIVAGIYFSAGFPELCGGDKAVLLFSLTAMAVPTAILLSGGRRSQLMQNVLVALLVLTLVAYCGAATSSDSFDFRAVLGSSVGSMPRTGIFNAVPLAMVAYGGCVAIAFMFSEVKSPSRNVPRSLWLGLAIVTLLYVWVIVSIVGTLPVSVLSENETLRYSPLMAPISDNSAAAALWLNRLVATSSILAQLTTITVLIRVNARALQAMAADGFFPRRISRENALGVQKEAISILAFVGVVICFLSRWAFEIISLGAVLNVVSIVITCAAAVKSASTRKLSPRKRRSRIVFPVVVVCVLVGCYLSDIVEGGSLLWLFTLVTYAVGMLIYATSRKVNPAFYGVEPVARIEGIVIHGKGRGHRYGIPTANLSIVVGQKLPEYGVWATRVILDGEEYEGLTNVGLRPTDDDIEVPTVETIILGMNPSRNIYGHAMALEFFIYVRPTIKFSSLDELKLQIDKDKEVFRY